MSETSKVFAGREFLRYGEAGQGLWSYSLDDRTDRQIIIRENPEEELWVLYNTCTGQEAIAIDLHGVGVVLSIWLSQARHDRIRAAIAAAQAAT